MSEWRDEGYRNKNAKFRIDKKNKKQQLKNAQRNKNSFVYDKESSNVNDIPISIYNENKYNENQKSKINKNIEDNSILLNNEDDKLKNKIQINEKNNDDDDDDDEEYEEFTPDYFEPVVYVKK